MFRLKANKTSLYKLVGEFEDLPPMRRVTITKAYRAPDWWLKWTDADGLLCVAFFSTCMGKAMVSEGIPEDMITKLWGMGEIVRIEHLREHNYYSGIDHGQDYTGLANYLFDHWTPEQGGHRWKKAGKLDKPDREPSTEVKRNYTENKPPRPPKGYILVESKATKYGYLYYKYVRQPEPPKKARRKKAGSG